jgi:hypothetical protein
MEGRRLKRLKSTLKLPGVKAKSFLLAWVTRARLRLFTSCGTVMTLDSAFYQGREDLAPENGGSQCKIGDSYVKSG